MVNLSALLSGFGVREQQFPFPFLRPLPLTLLIANANPSVHLDRLPRPLGLPIAQHRPAEPVLDHGQRPGQHLAALVGDVLAGGGEEDVVELLERHVVQTALDAADGGGAGRLGHEEENQQEGERVEAREDAEQPRLAGRVVVLVAQRLRDYGDKQGQDAYNREVFWLVIGFRLIRACERRWDVPAPNKFMNTAKLMPISRINRGKTSDEYANGTLKVSHHDSVCLGVCKSNTWTLAKRVRTYEGDHENDSQPSYSVCLDVEGQARKQHAEKHDWI